jgi:hypothetical protein
MYLEFLPHLSAWLGASNSPPQMRRGGSGGSSSGVVAGSGIPVAHDELLRRRTTPVPLRDTSPPQMRRGALNSWSTAQRVRLRSSAP